MVAEVTASEESEQVVLTFTYEEYGFSPSEAERVGKELIQKAAVAKE